MKEIVITKNEEGYKLKKLCMNYLNTAPASFIYKMLRKKNIVLNDKKADGNETLYCGDSVKMYLSDETIQKFRKESNDTPSRKSVKLDIIYEDDDIIIVNKPSGILSQKAKPDDYSINEAIIDYLLSKGAITSESLDTFHPSICNRLDRNTSGIILAGKTPAGSKYLSEQIRSRKMSKYYLAVAAGGFEYDKKYIECYLAKDNDKNLVQIYDKKPEEKAELIKTEIEIIKYNPERDLSLVKVKLITGKSHQIRAVLSHMGHPILGDYKYGSRRINDMYKKEFGINTQLLHAYLVEFSDGREFHADVPDIFNNLLAL